TLSLHAALPIWIARRMRQAQGIRGGDVLARVPHRGLWRERDEVEQERRTRRDGSGVVRRAIIEGGAHIVWLWGSFNSTVWSRATGALPSSIVHHPSSIVHRPSSIVHRPSSIIRH